MRTARRQAVAGGEWLRGEARVAMALLVAVEGSAPLRPGSSMLVSAAGEIEGSITGGCVEGAVAEEALALLAGDGAPRSRRYGFSDELAGTVGLTCGGSVEVLVHELRGAAREVEAAAMEEIAAERPVAVATLLDGERAGAKLALVDGEPIGSLGGPASLDQAVGGDLAGMLARGGASIRRYGRGGARADAELAVQLRATAPAPAMLIFGAVDFAAALAALAAELGYAVTICDPRAPFLDSPRFAAVAATAVAWPEDVLRASELGERDAVLVFSHDPKLDLPALRAALASGAGYIGALGSRRTSAERERRLRQAGFGEDELARIHAPCGLDIGGATPEEVALSVLAEIVASRNARPGAPLREGSGSIRPRG